MAKIGTGKCPRRCVVSSAKHSVSERHTMTTERFQPSVDETSGYDVLFLFPLSSMDRLYVRDTHWQAGNRREN